MDYPQSTTTKDKTMNRVTKLLSILGIAGAILTPMVANAAYNNLAQVAGPYTRGGWQTLVTPSGVTLGWGYMGYFSVSVSAKKNSYLTDYVTMTGGPGYGLSPYTYSDGSCWASDGVADSNWVTSACTHGTPGAVTTFAYY
jgi:hypothetical protein